eukprot:3903597-Prorocentrum_lima.AAC.1
MERTGGEKPTIHAAYYEGNINTLSACIAERARRHGRAQHGSPRPYEGRCRVLLLRPEEAG